jgi:Zn-finger nucleic acid-binding protein
MFACPVCRSARIVQVISTTRRAFCIRCGTRWVQDGPSQRAIERVASTSRRPAREPAPIPAP